MSDIENNNDNAEQNNVDVVDYKAKYEEAQKAIEALVAKKDELLKETKAAKDEKRKAAQAVEDERQKQAEIAQKNGEFEKLWKHEQEEKKQLAEKLDATNKRHREGNINIVAKSVALELAKNDGTKAELLSEFLAKSIGKVADEYGQIEHDVLASIKKEFGTNERYAPLLAGNLSQGSGAPGNKNTSGIKQTISRADFESLGYAQRQQFLKKGGKLSD